MQVGIIRDYFVWVFEHDVDLEDRENQLVQKEKGGIRWRMLYKQRHRINKVQLDSKIACLLGEVGQMEAKQKSLDIDTTIKEWEIIDF